MSDPSDGTVPVWPPETKPIIGPTNINLVDNHTNGKDLDLSKSEDTTMALVAANDSEETLIEEELSKKN